MNSANRTICLSNIAAAVPLLFAFAGCRPAVAPTVTTTSTLLRAPAVRSIEASIKAARHVQAMPLYKQAQALCRQKQFTQAAALLNQLSCTPGLPPDEIAFCNQQREICLHPEGHADARPVHPITSSPHPIRAVRHPITSDCGPRALLLAFNEMGIKATLPALIKAAGTDETLGTTMDGLKTAAESFGIKAEGVQLSREALAEAPTPAVAWVDYDHYIEVVKLRGAGETGIATIHDPNKPSAEDVPMEKLLRMSSGYLLLLKR